MGGSIHSNLNIPKLRNQEIQELGDSIGLNFFNPIRLPHPKEHEHEPHSS
jgi:hypothetical protein